MSRNKTEREEEDRPLLKGQGYTDIGYNSNNTSLNDDAIVIETVDRRTGKVSANIRNVILAALNILFNVSMNVTLPIYSGTIEKVGADAYVLLSQAGIFFVILLTAITQILHYTFSNTINMKPTASFKVLTVMGLLNALSGIFAVYASPPDRTPPYLQALLATSGIPFTVVCRLIFLRKGINLPRTVVVCCVMVGMFITAMPQLWGLPGSDSSGGDNHQSTLSRILWPLCFAMAFLPVGLMNVICEKELKKGEGGSLSFMLWTQVFQTLSMYLLFWTDFIPGFGMADSVQDLFHRLRIGWQCTFSMEAACYALPLKAWMFAVSYVLANLFQFLLIQYAEGAVYASVVQAIVSPTAALFWTLFKFDVDSNHFFWSPQFTETTAFTAVGVCIIIPSVMLYNYFSVVEEKEKRARETPEHDNKDT